MIAGASQLGFSTLAETVLALALLYQLRAVERLLGSWRFAAFVVAAGMVGQALAVAVGMVLRLESVAMGPYVLVFACVYQFYVLVPTVLQTRVLGVVDVGDKWTVYATAAALVAPRLAATGVLAMAGVAASMVYDANVAGLKQWRLPRWAKAIATNARNVGTSRVPADEPVVSAEQVELISAMFPDMDREHIRSMLRMVGNDSNRAVAMLLDSAT
ncbi:hypothetical protein EV174_002269 [Coemansia sp. RSA 2320]|nr:hypothetical protein EV174_002269 [Coemansia sp. RSA 2320]